MSGQRIALLGLVGALVVGAVLFVGFYLGRPTMESLYSGLDQKDIGRMTAELAASGISFDIDEQRSSILVRPADKARARVLLAQTGLPSTSSSGYELFDQLGSLGLTSFMQEVTRVRALEGEIVRTIQALEGVEAARVHLVMPESGVFRRSERDPSASVMLRLGPAWRAETTEAVRNIVAAAIAGMKVEHVSVASSDGRVLAAGGDERSLAGHNHTMLEDQIARELEERAVRTLAPALGAQNVRISATVELDIDRQTSSETIFSPESKVERSTRVVRQVNESENSTRQAAAGVEANIPEEVPEGGAGGDSSRQKDEKREETTNFEISSKRVETERQGYRIKRVALAAIINREQIVKSLGPNASEAQVSERIAEMRRLIAAATGYAEDRGDTLEISAISFEAAPDLARDDTISPFAYVAMSSGTIATALAVVIVAVLLIFLAIRPALRALAASRPPEQLDSARPDAIGMGDMPELIGSSGDEFAAADAFAAAELEAAEQLGEHELPPIERLSRLVERDPGRVARVMREWLKEEREA